VTDCDGLVGGGGDANESSAEFVGPSNVGIPVTVSTARTFFVDLERNTKRNLVLDGKLPKRRILGHGKVWPGPPVEH
jgi:hypothetical protein